MAGDEWQLLDCYNNTKMSKQTIQFGYGESISTKFARRPVVELSISTTELSTIRTKKILTAILTGHCLFDKLSLSNLRYYWSQWQLYASPFNNSLAISCIEITICFMVLKWQFHFWSSGGMRVVHRQRVIVFLSGASFPVLWTAGTAH